MVSPVPFRVHFFSYFRMSRVRHLRPRWSLEIAYPNHPHPHPFFFSQIFSPMAGGHWGKHRRHSHLASRPAPGEEQQKHAMSSAWGGSRNFPSLGFSMSEWRLVFTCLYPLVNIPKTSKNLWKITIFDYHFYPFLMGKSTIPTGPFSIAILVYQVFFVGYYWLRPWDCRKIPFSPIIVIWRVPKIGVPMGTPNHPNHYYIYILYTVIPFEYWNPWWLGVSSF